MAPVIPSPISAADSTHKTNGKSEEDKVIGAAPRAKKCIPNDEFLQQLKLLNKSVLAWADQHVRENPYIDVICIRLLELGSLLIELCDNFSYSRYSATMRII